MVNRLKDQDSQRSLDNRCSVLLLPFIVYLNLPFFLQIDLPATLFFPG